MKLKSTRETEVFVNQPGYLTIKQAADDSYHGEPQVVMFSPEQAKLVAEELLRYVAVRDTWWNPAEDDEEDEAA
jgi:hypothetical protein